MSRHHHRPTTPGDRFFDAIEAGADPAQVREAGDQAATILVRGARRADDPGVAERLLRLADTEGIETIAEVWSGAPADTLAGCLWRLYLLRSWVHSAPVQAAHEFEAGRQAAPVARVVAGVAEPPGPEELKAVVDQVLRGIARGDFADVLFRAAAFSRVIAAGRAHLPETGEGETHRMLRLSEELEAAGHAELDHHLA